MKATEEPVTSPGRGRRICPNCNLPTSSRSAVCKHCGHEVVQRTRSDEAISFEHVLRIIERNGGLDKAKERIHEVEIITEELVGPLGGLQRAVQAIKALDRLTNR